MRRGQGQKITFVLALAVCACAETRPLALRARAAAEQGDFAAAEQLYRQALKAEPRNVALWNGLGVALNREERYTDAAEAFRAALRLSPGVAGLKLNLGIALFRAGKLGEAAAIFENLPENEQARQLLAMSYVELARYDRALPLLEQLAVSSTDPTIHISLATCYSALGRKADAERAVARMFEVVPDSPALHVALGEAYEQERAPDRAIAEFRKGGAHLQAGRLLWKLYRFDDAVGELQAALAADPTNADAKYYLGSSYLYNNEPEKAIAPLQEFVKIRPKEKNGFFELGQALLKTGDLKRAIPAFETAVALSPDEANLHYTLAQSYRRAGRMQEARREFAASKRLESEQLQGLSKQLQQQKN